MNGGGVKKAEKRQKSRDLGKISVICTVWTLQITDFEAMPENHQKSYGLQNLTEGSLDQRKCSIKIWGWLDHGKVIQMLIQVQKITKFNSWAGKSRQANYRRFPAALTHREKKKPQTRSTEPSPQPLTPGDHTLNRQLKQPKQGKRDQEWYNDDSIDGC